MDQDLVRGRQINLVKEFDTVSLQIVCGDEYEAEILYEAIQEVYNLGQPIILQNHNAR